MIIYILYIFILYVYIWNKQHLLWVPTDCILRPRVENSAVLPPFHHVGDEGLEGSRWSFKLANYTSLHFFFQGGEGNFKGFLFLRWHRHSLFLFLTPNWWLLGDARGILEYICSEALSEIAIPNSKLFLIMYWEQSDWSNSRYQRFLSPWLDNMSMQFKLIWFYLNLHAYLKVWNKGLSIPSKMDNLKSSPEGCQQSIPCWNVYPYFFSYK